MLPWNQSLCSDDDSELDEWLVQVPCSQTRILTFNGTRLRSPGFLHTEDPVERILRQVCHVLVDQIDSKGLQDVCQSLAEFYEFYRPIQPSPPLLDGIRTQEAVVNSRSVSPTSSVEEP